MQTHVLVLSSRQLNFLSGKTIQDPKRKEKIKGQQHLAPGPPETHFIEAYAFIYSCNFFSTAIL